jgi:hypothetical protein
MREGRRQAEGRQKAGRRQKHTSMDNFEIQAISFTKDDLQREPTK